MNEINFNSDYCSIKAYETTFIEPNWPAPPNVRAYSTTRKGGFSLPPFDSFNLALHVGDSEKNVHKNRELLADKLALPSQPHWLEQNHSDHVLNVQDDQNQTLREPADGSYTSQKNVVCTVMTADCLPVLICNKAGSWVASVHAGWKGLASGIIENAINCYPGKSSELIAWLGPAISAARFEVGEDVREIFVTRNKRLECYFKINQHNKFQCDLKAIARDILTSYKAETYGGGYCSFTEENQFYSYRRDQETGRMASLIWLNSDHCSSVNTNKQPVGKRLKINA